MGGRLKLLKNFKLTRDTNVEKGYILDGAKEDENSAVFTLLDETSPFSTKHTLMRKISVSTPLQNESLASLGCGGKNPAGGCRWRH